ncbi:hypothetical protein P261_01338 [Lachnospiraceae bacterium TWA4]|nr:hypothetical protein P261_01338 [Lachnospiraceae bacterium TWA4]
MPFLSKNKLMIKFRNFMQHLYPKKYRMRRVFVSASATIEAAIVLSFLLIAFISLYIPFFTMYIQINLQSSLENACKKEAIYAYPITKKLDSTNYELGKGYLLASLASDSMVSKINRSCINEGIVGVSFNQSSFLGEDGMIDIVANYQVSIPFIPSFKQNFIQRARRRAWLGENLTNGEILGSEESEFVYVAQTGGVYHLYGDCSHIKLSVHMVDYSRIKNLRNTNGGIYHSCERCKPKSGGGVYITDDGDKYHKYASCSGIKRSVNQVHKSEVGGMRVCSRCKARKELED